MKIVTGPRIAERAQLRNSYILREFSLENEAVKQVQRDRVRDHFFKYHPKSPMRLFSLPGAWWTFERQIEGEWENAVEFVAVEKNYSILTHGLPFMPGAEKTHPDHPLVDDSVKYFESSKALAFWCNLDYFMSLGKKHKGGKSQVSKWSKRFKRWTCAWFDFTSPICDSTLHCLRRMEGHFEYHQPVVPFAVTFLMGREKRGLSKIMRSATGLSCPIACRAAFIENWYNHLSPRRYLKFTDQFQYESSGGAAMLLLLGTLYLNDKTIDGLSSTKRRQKAIAEAVK